MNPVDRINLVSMQQERKLHEKRCEVQGKLLLRNFLLLLNFLAACYVKSSKY